MSSFTAAAVLVSARSGVCTPLCLTGDFDSQLRHILRELTKSVGDPADILSSVLHDVQSTLEQRWQVITTAAMLVSARNGALCLTGDFDSQLRYILNEQMKSAENPADVVSGVLNDVQTTLNQRWQGYKAIPYGSLTTGLLTPSSDVDFHIQLPRYNSRILQEVYKLFKKQRKLYKNMKYYDKGNYSSIQFFHVPSQRKVDLMFEFGEMAVANSKLLKYYFNLDERFLPLGQFLKLWSEIQRRNDHRLPRDYILYLLMVFYLQQKKMAPPVYMLQRDSKSHFIHNWDVGFNELPYKSTNTENLQQLLAGFFKYYSEFNYEEYAIAPFAGRPIRKSAFQDIENFPEEYTLYNSNLKHKLQRQILNNFDVSATVCVQDPFMHYLNEVTRLRSNEDAMSFKHFMKSVAKKFKDLPSESILSDILVRDQPKKKVISHEQFSAAGGHEQVCIDIL